jgi:pyruvate dehydrogenase E2 component (dihydrolipoamide acetyltransferase)
MAAEAGIAIDQIDGSGPGGRILMSDVSHAIANGVAPRAAAGSADGAADGFARFFPPYEDVSVTTIKKVTAARLTESKRTVPHFYLSVDVRMDQIVSARAKLNAGKEKGKISVNDFVVKAAASALKQVPDVNASWMGDKIRVYKNADISVAVQTDAGLMVPIVRNACGLGLSGISSEVRVLAGKAKEGKLSPADMIGGTFTISNLGMFGIKQFAAIVNPPQAAILAVGAARKEVVKKADGSGYEEALLMSATLSCDHRVVDGAVGAQWLGAFKAFMEDPVTMLL